jgi:hypothetical protein
MKSGVGFFYGFQKNEAIPMVLLQLFLKRLFTLETGIGFDFDLPGLHFFSKSIGPVENILGKCISESFFHYGHVGKGNSAIGEIHGDDGVSFEFTLYR